MAINHWIFRGLEYIIFNMYTTCEPSKLNIWAKLTADKDGYSDAINMIIWFVFNPVKFYTWHYSQGVKR